MTIDKDTEGHAASTKNLASGSSSMDALVSDKDSLDLELEAAANEIEALAVKYENAGKEDSDKFVTVVLPTEGPKQKDEVQEGDKEEEKEEVPPQKTWKDWFIDLLPVCPPPVCGVLKEQLITFTVIVIIGLIFFLIYWFVE